MNGLASDLFTITESDLLEKHEKDLAHVIEELEGDVDSERITQVAIALRNLLYWQSKQYVRPVLGDGRVIEFKEADLDKVKFKSVYNIYESDGVKFIGAVSTRAPNAKAFADDDESEKDIQSAKNVDGALRFLARQWDSNRLQKELAFHAWNTGPTFGLTSYVADGHKYGWAEEPVIDVEDVDMGLGETMPVPKQTGTKKYPKGGVELSLYSVLYVTIPYAAKKIADVPWLRLEFMEHKSRLKGLYEQLTDEKFERHDGAGAGQSEAIAAQHKSVSPSGQESEQWSKNRWRWTRYWLRPSEFPLIPGDVIRVDENGEEVKRKLSKVLLEQFPDGMQLALVNGKLVKVFAERLDDVLSVCKTGKGDRILSEPWGNNLIPIQDDLNDFFNMAKEIILRSIPKTLVSSDLFDPKRVEENDPEINEYIRVKMQAGMPLGNMMAPFPLSRMPDQLMPFSQFMRSVSREVSQVNEALSGGGPPAPTFRGEKMRRDQSMMAFAPWFDEAQSFWEHAYTNGIRQWAKYGSGSMKVPGEDGKGAMWVDPAMIEEEGWHIEAEEGIPMSHAEQVDQFKELLNENNPEIAKSLGLLSPTNSGHVFKFLGLPGFKAPDDLARIKAQLDIQKLLGEPPIPDVDPMTGEQIGLLPSIPADRTVDKPPALFAQIYRDWCFASQETDMEKNPDGYANVRARLEEYEAWDAEMMAQQAMAGAPPPEAGGPPPPGPPPMGGPPIGEAPPPEPFDTAPPDQKRPSSYRVIRDEQGRISGLESDTEQKRVVRDDQGRLSGIEISG